MTFKEKLAQERPKLVDDKYTGGCKGCPSVYGYEKDSDCSGKPFSDKKCTKCWNREMPDTPAQMTAEEAWELAKEIYTMEYIAGKSIFPDECNGGNVFVNVLNKYTPQEAKAKIEEWERHQQIQVGDVVMTTSGLEAIVLKVNEGTFHLLFPDGSCGKHPKKYKKTGKHIDIQSVLNQIGGEGND